MGNDTNSGRGNNGIQNFNIILPIATHAKVLSNSDTEIIIDVNMTRVIQLKSSICVAGT